MQRKKKNRVLEILEQKAGLTPQVASRFLNEVLVEHQANLATWMYDTYQSDSDIYSEQDKLGLRYGALFLGYEEEEGRNINTHFT